MSERDPLVERVDRLERSVGELRHQVRSLSRGLEWTGEYEESGAEPPVSRDLAEPGSRWPDTRSAPSASPGYEPLEEREERAGPGVGEVLRRLAERLPFGAENLRSWEWWFNRVGIALLLFGIAFLFKFSLDQGWLQRVLTEPVQVGIGLVAGFSLLAVGMRLYDERRGFSQVLLGGGVGALYTTGFAAYGLYSLVAHPVAFGFMVAVTVLAFSLSVRQDDVSLSLIGTLGGLGTPFILYTGEANTTGLVLYACLLLAGAGAVYLLKGWRSLLAVSFAGGWAVLAAGHLSGDDRVAVQVGAAFAWLVFWLIPVLREVLRSRDPQRWTLPAPGPTFRAISRFIGGAEGFFGGAASHAHLLSVSAPLIALTFTWRIWDLPGDSLGWICFAAAALYALAALALRRAGDAGGLSRTQALTALMLLTLGIVLILEGNALLFTLAAEAAVLHFVSRRVSGRIVAVKANLLFLAAALWLAFRILQGILEGALGGIFAFGPEPTAFFGADAAVDLAVVALAFVASLATWPRALERAYTIFGHVALLGWLTRELLIVPGGAEWAFLCWGVYAAGLHLLSRRAPRWGSLALAHVIAVGAGLWLLQRLIAGEALHLAVLNPRGVLDLAVILLAAAVSFLLSSRAASVYRLAVAGAFSLWLLRELYPLPEGSGWTLLAWTLFAFALIPASRRLSDGALIYASHLQFAAAGVLLCGRLLEDLARSSVESPVLLNSGALLNVAAIVVAALASRMQEDARVTLAYRLVSHVAVLALLWGELWALPSGYAYVTIGWGLYGAGLLVAGLRWDHTQLIRGGMATLFLVVGKLFLVDLGGVEAIWRILLFIGFGGLFLVLGYYLRSLWRPGSGGSSMGGRS